MQWQHFAEASVQGTLLFARLAWLSIGRVRAGAHRVIHDPRRFGSRAGSDLHVVLSVSGTSVVEHGGRAFTLQAGRWTILSGDRSYTLTSRARTERLVMVIGRGRFAADINLPQLAGHAYSAANGTGRLLFATALCVADELPYIRAGNAAALAEQLTALLQIAVRHEISLGSQEDNDVRRERVHRYLARHLSDPQLSVERIASDLGWSRRTLARIFEVRGETLMEHVYRERLEGVRRDLLNPALQERSLADIARSWGFRNYTHFSHRFRSHFGLSPTAARGVRDRGPAPVPNGG